jgi:hypothetical protein
MSTAETSTKAKPLYEPIPPALITTTVKSRVKDNHRGERSLTPC